MSATVPAPGPERSNSPQHMAASYWLEGLNEIGVDYLFCNLGTDHAPIIETMAQWRQAGRPYPKVILCPHENVAMHMAIGYTRMTGRTQAVLVHVDAGTANAAMGMHNAFRSRVPLVLFAGTAPFTVRGELLGTRDTYIHFIQDPYDMRGIVRNYVKWEYQLPSGVVVKESLRRAFTMADTDPKGPVFMTLPREVLSETWDASQIASFPADAWGPCPARGVDAETIGQMADRLLEADNPLIITTYAGRNPRTPALIEELAELLGIGVVESYPQVLNISKASPCFLGNRADDMIKDVDVGLMLDTDVPWMPRDTIEKPNSFWIHVDVDVIKKDVPLWGFPGHLKVEGDSEIILRQLLDALRPRITDVHRQRAAARIARFTASRVPIRAQIEKLGIDKGAVGAINPGYLCAELNKVLGQDDILVSESVMNEPSVGMQFLRTQPGTLIGLGGGGLGFGGGAALGAKLAQPDHFVLHMTGDGSFYFMNPSAVFEVSREYNLPIFTVVFENGGWSAVKECTIKTHPDGVARETDEFQARLNPTYRFQMVAEAAGAHGEEVADPKALPAAIARCVKAVREEGRPACLVAHVRRL